MERWYLFPLLLASILICLPVASPAQPDINVEPAEFEFNGDGGEGGFTITNTGNADVRWLGVLEVIQEPERRAPFRDDPGEVLGQFRGINAADEHCSPIGWDWENEIMWITNANRRLIVGYGHDGNYENFEEEMRIGGGPYFDGAWANGLLYLPPLFAFHLNRYTANGQNAGAMQLPFQVVGVAADIENGWLFLVSSGNEVIHVYELEENGGVGDEIGTIDDHLEYHNNAESFGIEWVPKHPDGQLWMIAPNTGRVHQITVDTDNWECTGEVLDFIAFPGEQEAPESSVAHDGHHMWAGGVAADNIRVYDDGNTELYWLIFQPHEGTVDPEQSTDVFLVFDATGLVAGDYEANINIISNDPDEPEVIVHVRAEVVEAEDIAVEWPEEAGFPDIIDFNQAFDNNVFVGFEQEIEVIITNEGIDDLEISEVYTTNEYFLIEPNDDLIIAPGRALVCQLTFLTDEIGLYEGTLNFVTNVPDVALIEIPIHAQAILAPRIAIDPEEIVCELAWREAIEFMLNIANVGESDLRWRCELTGVEDNVRPVFGPIDGVIAADADQDINLRIEFIESDSLPSEFNLTFFSNDPETPEKNVHIVVQTLKIQDATANIPTTTRLVSLYPNPFNSMLTILYATGGLETAASRLAVYGVDGREVKNLFGSTAVTGGRFHPAAEGGATTHSVVWKADGVPAGQYIVRLNAGQKVVSERVVTLVK